ncbi:MAG: tripartite tricarboxylate transporter TctB family protein, partial [Tateyamaria sp.]|nr:tripartite tricarboxylate transporter TctB family protein [Tateyamaria sp.]
MNDLPRNQHIIASGIVASVGIWVTYISYTQEPAAAFLFPRMISTVFAVLALWTFGKALMGCSKVGAGLSI